MKLAKLNSITEQHIVGSVYNMFSCFTETSFAQVFSSRVLLIRSFIFYAICRCSFVAVQDSHVKSVYIPLLKKEWQVMLDYVPQQKYRFHMINSTYSTSISFPVHHKWKHLQKVLISKASFLPLKRKCIFKSLERFYREPCDLLS